MRFDVITLFPELFKPFLTSGVTRRAFETRAVEVHLHQLRDFAQGSYKRVDDRPFGGGPGMVLMAEPLAQCVTAIQARRGGQACPVVLFCPQGEVLNHTLVQHWAESEGAIVICGRYEGLDQRFIDTFVTDRISLGDFVLSGGEIAAMALLDSVARLQVDVLGDQDSHAFDSFNPEIGGLLDCPHYTRPEVWQGHEVPRVLMSGNHKLIEQWRLDQSIHQTALSRPDVLEQAKVIYPEWFKKAQKQR
jgi:tRNA (guanine37-N1)-methyltransferase